MDRKLYVNPIGRGSGLAGMLRFAVLATVFVGGAGRAAEVVFDDCEAGESAWTVDLGRSRGEVLVHRRQSDVFHGGQRAEELQFRGTGVEPEIGVGREIPRGRVLDELIAEIWVRSNRAGVALALTVVFPQQIDPRTGRPLAMTLRGAPAKGEGDWELLSCSTSDRAMAQLRARARSLLDKQVGPQGPALDEPIVEAVWLLAPVTPGVLELFWDDLHVGPLVPPDPDIAAALSAVPEAPRDRLTFADDRLLQGAEPMFLRMITHRDESAALIRDSGVNAVWVEDAEDAPLLESLRDSGLVVVATPPAAVGDGADGLGLAPFGRATDPVDLWMLGRVGPRSLGDVARWVSQVQDADRDFGRLILADVPARTREFHRVVNLLGASRHIPHTTTTPADYAAFLELRRRQALPGRPLATMLPTEAAEATLASRSVESARPVVEPETTALCAHLAMASGYKLLGFWTHTPLDAEWTGARERLCMLRLLNIEMHLLSPWLASARVLRTTELTTGQALETRSRSVLGFNPFRSRWDAPAAAAEGRASPLRATILKGDPGLLILADWLDPLGQFQPGAMTARDLRMVAPRFDDAAQAWLVTTTSVRQIKLDLRPVPGGLEIPLESFDQHAAIVMSADSRVIAELERSVQQVREPAAHSWVELAHAKLERVEAVLEELRPMAPRVKAADEVLPAARRQLEAARQELRAGRFDEARQASQKVLELTRIIQRACWDQAVASLSSPVSSPHTLCFQTLPDHYRLQETLAAAPAPSRNLLVSGDFEDENAVVAAGWRFESTHLASDAQFLCEVSLEEPSTQGRRGLRMTAQPRDVRQTVAVDEPLMSVVTPPLKVYQGQIVRATGKVLVPGPLSGSVDGLIAYDNLRGTVGAQRFGPQGDPRRWQSFEFIREVHASGDFSLHFELWGAGEAWLDDLQVAVVQPAE